MSYIDPMDPLLMISHAQEYYKERRKRTNHKQKHTREELVLLWATAVEFSYKANAIRVFRRMKAYHAYRKTIQEFQISRFDVNHNLIRSALKNELSNDPNKSRFEHLLKIEKCIKHNSAIRDNPEYKSNIDDINDQLVQEIVSKSPDFAAQPLSNDFPDEFYEYPASLNQNIHFHHKTQSSGQVIPSLELRLKRYSNKSDFRKISKHFHKWRKSYQLKKTAASFMETEEQSAIQDSGTFKSYFVAMTRNQDSFQPVLNIYQPGQNHKQSSGVLSLGTNKTQDIHSSIPSFLINPNSDPSLPYKSLRGNLKLKALKHVLKYWRKLELAQTRLNYITHNLHVTKIKENSIKKWRADAIASHSKKAELSSLINQCNSAALMFLEKGKGRIISRILQKWNTVPSELKELSYRVTLYKKNLLSKSRYNFEELSSINTKVLRSALEMWYVQLQYNQENSRKADYYFLFKIWNRLYLKYLNIKCTDQVQPFLAQSTRKINKLVHFLKNSDTPYSKAKNSQLFMPGKSPKNAYSASLFELLASHQKHIIMNLDDLHFSSNSAKIIELQNYKVEEPVDYSFSHFHGSQSRASTLKKSNTATTQTDFDHDYDSIKRQKAHIIAKYLDQGIIEPLESKELPSKRTNNLNFYQPSQSTNHNISAAENLKSVPQPHAKRSLGESRIQDSQKAQTNSYQLLHPGKNSAFSSANASSISYTHEEPHKTLAGKKLVSIDSTSTKGSFASMLAQNDARSKSNSQTQNQYTRLSMKSSDYQTLNTDADGDGNGDGDSGKEQFRFNKEKCLKLLSEYLEARGRRVTKNTIKTWLEKTFEAELVSDIKEPKIQILDSSFLAEESPDSYLHKMYSEGCTQPSSVQKSNGTLPGTTSTGNFNRLSQNKSYFFQSVYKTPAVSRQLGESDADGRMPRVQSHSSFDQFTASPLGSFGIDSDTGLAFKTPKASFKPKPNANNFTFAEPSNPKTKLRNNAFSEFYTTADANTENESVKCKFNLLMPTSLDSLAVNTFENPETSNKASNPVLALYEEPNDLKSLKMFLKANLFNRRKTLRKCFGKLQSLKPSISERAKKPTNNKHVEFLRTLVLKFAQSNNPLESRKNMHMAADEFRSTNLKMMVVLSFANTYRSHKSVLHLKNIFADYWHRANSNRRAILALVHARKLKQATPYKKPQKSR